MQDLTCSDDSSTENSVTSTTHVTDDIGESQAGESHPAVDSSSESDSQQTMTSKTSRHATLNSTSRSPSRPSSALHVPTTSLIDGAANLRQPSPTSKTTESYHVTQKNLDAATDSRAGRVDCSVQDLEKMLSQVEASERQAWNWLEGLESENSGDLCQYITSMEQNKRQTSEAIAQLLQIECDLRQQLNRKRSAAAGLQQSADNDDAIIDDVSKSLRDIVGRLQGPSFKVTNTAGTEHFVGVSPSSLSRYPTIGSEAAAVAGFLHRNQNGGVGGVDSDEGYDGNSNSLQSDSIHGNRDAEPTTARINTLEMEVIRLTRLLDAYRWSHGENRSSTQDPGAGQSATAAGYADAYLLQAQCDVHRLQSRVNDLETEKLELERELNKATSKLRDEVEKLQIELQLQKNESNHTIAELKDIETGQRRTERELREQLEFEKDKRQCLEKELLDTVEGRQKLRQQLQEADRSSADLREKLDVAEQSNGQLVAQVNFLTKTNESLMEDIDDSNERMSEELGNCRQGRRAAEERCNELEAHCEKLTETVGLLADRARSLEKSLEEAERERLECERLRHEHGVLVASEEKLVDKINDRDKMTRRLMEELSECKASLEEQGHKLQMANAALDSYKNDSSRCLRELEDTRSREKEVQESEQRLMLRVKELEMTEAVLSTKLSAAEKDKEHLCRVETDLKSELEESRRGEKDLLEKVASSERRENTLLEKVERLESRTSHLVELLRNTQEMSLHHQLRGIFDVSNIDDDVDDDGENQHSPALHLLPDGTSVDPSGQQASGYDPEKLTKVELLTKVYQLERSCVLQRSKIHDLNNELSTFRQTVAEASHRQMDTVLPALMSTVENKVSSLLYSRVK